MGFLVLKRIYKLYIDIDEKSVKYKKERNQEIENVINGFVEVKSFMTNKLHIESIKNSNLKIFNNVKSKAKINIILKYVY